MKEKFRCAIQLVEYEDGSLTAQTLRPDGITTDFYGRFLYPNQLQTLGFQIWHGLRISNGVIEPTRIGNYEDPEFVYANKSELQLRWKEFDNNKHKIAPLVINKKGKFCFHCGTTKNITIDHIIPLSKGGTNYLNNLQPLCKSCNSRKGDR